MAEKKKPTREKDNASNPPTLAERITDMSIGGYGKPVFIPKEGSEEENKALRRVFKGK